MLRGRRRAAVHRARRRPKLACLAALISLLHTHTARLKPVVISVCSANACKSRRGRGQITSQGPRTPDTRNMFNWIRGGPAAGTADSPAITPQAAQVRESSIEKCSSNLSKLNAETADGERPSPPPASSLLLIATPPLPLCSPALCCFALWCHHEELASGRRWPAA